MCRALSLPSRWSYLLVVVFVVACKRTQHLAEGPPLPRANYDASVPMGVADPAAMARAMAAADAGARAMPGVPNMPPGVPNVPPGAVPRVPPVADAGAPVVPQMVVIDAGAAPIEPARAPRTRRRRR